jgi:hypothetical protein
LPTVARRPAALGPRRSAPLVPPATLARALRLARVRTWLVAAFAARQPIDCDDAARSCECVPLSAGWPPSTLSFCAACGLGCAACASASSCTACTDSHAVPAAGSNGCTCPGGYFKTVSGSALTCTGTLGACVRRGVGGVLPWCVCAVCVCRCVCAFCALTMALPPHQRAGLAARPAVGRPPARPAPTRTLPPSRELAAAPAAPATTRPATRPPR